MTILMRFNGYHDDSRYYRYESDYFTEGKMYQLINGSVKRFFRTDLIPEAEFISNSGEKFKQELSRFTYIKKSER